jgi:tetratricopeptide (TPR) repeat protein
VGDLAKVSKTRQRELLSVCYTRRRREAMDEKMQKAVELFNNQDYDSALEIFEEFLKKEPRNAGLLNNIGTAYFKKGNLEKAAEYYMSGIQADPKLKQLYKNLSDIYVQKKDVLSAIGVLQEAVAFMPDENYLRYALAQLYIKDSLFDLAVDELHKILEINPDDLDARYDLAKVFFELGVYDSATQNYEVILEKINNNADLYFHTGCAYQADDEVDKAISSFLKTINISEGYYPAYKKLALCFLARGENQDAIEYFEDYLKFDISDEEKDSINKVIARLK